MQKRTRQARVFVAFILLSPGDGASLSPSHARNLHEEAQVKMVRLFRQMVVLAMLVVVPAGAFAQRKDRDKRPPKEPAKVIENKKDKDKGNRPRPDNKRPKPDNKKKP